MDLQGQPSSIFDDPIENEETQNRREEPDKHRPTSHVVKGSTDEETCDWKMKQIKISEPRESKVPEIPLTDVG